MSNLKGKEVQFVGSKSYAASLAASVNDPGGVYHPTDRECLICGGRVYWPGVDALLTHYRGRVDFLRKVLSSSSHLEVDGMGNVSVFPPAVGEYVIALHNRSSRFHTNIFLWANGESQGDFQLDPGEIYVTTVEVTTVDEEIWFDACPEEEQDEGEAYEMGYVIAPVDNLDEMCRWADDGIPIMGAYKSVEDVMTGRESEGDFWVSDSLPGRVYVCSAPGSGLSGVRVYESMGEFISNVLSVG